MPTPETIHASAAALGGRGILIRGTSGSGKSTLLAALIAGMPPARLVADDRVVLTVTAGGVFAAAPPALAGLLEIRGAGIVRLPYVIRVPVVLVVDLLPLAACPRLPDEAQGVAHIAGVSVRRMHLAEGVVDGAARIRAVLGGAR